LITFGFSKVIQQYIEDLRPRYPSLEIELEAAVDDKKLSAQTHLTLFRIFQAGINNIIRHSNASKVWVVYRLEPDGFFLEIRDNGVGFELQKDFSHLTRGGHFGLVGMQERADAIGAEFSVSSEPGKGTTIIVHGPYTKKNLK
jgi:signal transduction histidine kinase